MHYILIFHYLPILFYTHTRNSTINCKIRKGIHYSISNSMYMKSLPLLQDKSMTSVQHPTLDDEDIRWGLIINTTAKKNLKTYWSYK